MTYTLETVQIQSLKLATYNPRKIRPDEFLNLKQSIQAFGMVQPVTVNKDLTVIAGHQRAAACEALGITQIPCFVIDVDKTQRAQATSYSTCSADPDPP